MQTSIRTQLILSFLAVVVLSLSGLSIMQIIAGTQSAQEEINRQLTTVVTYKGRILSEWANTLKAELGATLAGENLTAQIEAALAGGLNVSNEAGSQERFTVRSRLLSLAAGSRYFHELFLLDPKGDVIVSTDRTREGSRFRGEPFFEAARFTPYVSAPMFLKSDDAAVLFAGYPILDEHGELVGVLAGRAKTDVVQQIFTDATGMRENAETSLLDLQGRVIASSNPERRGQTIPAVRQAMAHGPITTTTDAAVLNYTDAQEAPLTGAYIRLSDLQGVLLVEQVSQEVRRTWAATLAVNLSVTLSSVAVAIFIALAATRTIANPIGDLVDISTQISQSAGQASQALAGATAGAAPAPASRRPSGPLHTEARELEARAHDWHNETGALALAFHQMTLQLSGLIGSLEQRVAERTAALEQHTRLLEASADVSRAATQILDLDRLISQAVELIRDRFGLYYVGLFLNDAENQWTVLRAGTGAPGQAMLARHHRLRIEPTSMIGWCIANDQARVAQAVAEDEVRVINPELPDTRSEAAIPLHARGQVIGALTVQSQQPGAFTAAAISTLQTMADQIAIAIDNAALFARSQGALDAERRAYARQTQAEWSEWARERSHLTVRGDPSGIAVIAAAPDNRIDDRALTAPAEKSQADKLAIPIRVRGHAIGVIHAGRSGSWSRDELIFLETIAEQLGVALDSARLYAETRKRAEQERLVDDLTGKMRATLDIQTVLETAAREMRSALGLAEVEVRLTGPENGAPRPADHPEGENR